jgi:Protein of unknown function (Porph_ging).
MFGQYIDPSMFRDDLAMDTATIEVSYRFTFVRDTLKPDVYTNPDEQTLLIGSKISKYFSQRLADKTEQGNFFSPIEGACSFEIFKNHSEGRMTVTDIGHDFLLGANFMYEEEMPKIDWKLTTDTCTILDYPCLKATTFFRGRDYEAWFTKVIPINDGPWKFHGLPGLILKVSDSKRQVMFEFAGFRHLVKPKSILLYDLEYKHTSRQELSGFYKECLDDAIGYAIKYKTELMGQIDYVPPGPYNPIEIE